MLIVASSTFAKVFTFRLNSILRWIEYFNDFPAREIFLLLRQPHVDAFARQPKWDKDRAAVVEASHRVAAVGVFFKLNVKGCRSKVHVV